MQNLSSLNPEIQELMEIATMGFSLFESARMRVLIQQEIEKAALCGMILPSQIRAIIDGILCREIIWLKQELNLLNDEEGT